MQFGLPAIIALLSALISICIKLGRLKNISDDVKACRAGLLISLAGIAVSLCTVDLWNASFSFFFFLLGSGLWILDQETKPAFAQPLVTRARKSLPYVRADNARRETQFQRQQIPGNQINYKPVNERKVATTVAAQVDDLVSGQHTQ